MSIRPGFVVRELATMARLWTGRLAGVAVRRRRSFTRAVLAACQFQLSENQRITAARSAALDSVAGRVVGDPLWAASTQALTPVPHDVIRSPHPSRIPARDDP